MMTDQRNLLTDVAGLAVGSASDPTLGSGVTVVVFDAPAVASAAVLGGAPGGRDTALLDPAMSVGAVDALVLSGGSAFGLDAAGGVMAGLRRAGRGLEVGPVRVPIVPQAILFDMINGGDKDWGLHSPYRDMGFAAFEAARPGAFALGSVGAGTGATTATVKGGLGSASARTPAGDTVAALVAVNALGAPTIGEGPHFWAAPFEEDAEFGGLGLPARFSADDLRLRVKGVSLPATTIGIVATDAALTKAAAHRLAVAAHDGLARAILPTHLPSDGDTMFAASTGHRPAPDEIGLMELCLKATAVMARAVARGVFEATALPVAGAQPAWRERFGSV